MGGENVAARASLDVGSKAMGGDLARLGAGGGASASGGEASAKDMVVNEDSSGLGRSSLKDVRSAVPTIGGRSEK